MLLKKYEWLTEDIMICGDIQILIDFAEGKKTKQEVLDDTSIVIVNNLKNNIDFEANNIEHFDFLDRIKFSYDIWKEKQNISTTIT